MRKAGFFLFLTIVLALTSANAFAVDVELLSPSDVSIGDSFDVEVRLTGSDSVGPFDLAVNFNPALLQMSDITPSVGFSAPAQTMIDEANTSGSLALSYLDVTMRGFTPTDDGMNVFVITFNATATGSDTITPSGTVTAAGFPPADITGTLTPATVSISNSSASEGVDITLQANDNVQTTFDVKAHMSGTERVGAFDLHISFDKDKVRITDILPLVAGVVVPGNASISNVNSDGAFTVGYANTSGFVPGADTKVVSISCEALVEEGYATFEIDNDTYVQNNIIPTDDITGTMTGKTVYINPYFVPLKGDADGNEIVNSIDALYILHFIAGNISSDMLEGNCDVNSDGVIDAADALYVLHYVAGNIIDFP